MNISGFHFVDRQCNKNMNNETAAKYKDIFPHNIPDKASNSVYIDNFTILTIFIVRLSYFNIFISDVCKLVGFPNTKILSIFHTWTLKRWCSQPSTDFI